MGARTQDPSAPLHRWQVWVSLHGYRLWAVLTQRLCMLSPVRVQLLQTSLTTFSHDNRNDGNFFHCSNHTTSLTHTLWCKLTCEGTPQKGSRDRREQPSLSAIFYLKNVKEPWSWILCWEKLRPKNRQKRPHNNTPNELVESHNYFHTLPFKATRDAFKRCEWNFLNWSISLEVRWEKKNQPTHNNQFVVHGWLQSLWNKIGCRVWWYRPIIPELGRLGEKNMISRPARTTKGRSCFS